MSNKRKRGKIPVVLTKEYVTLIHIIATEGQNEKFGNRFKKKNGEGIGEYIQ